MKDWDRSLDWVLIRSTSDRLTLTVHFQEHPTLKELAAIRRCWPPFQNTSPVDVKNQIANGMLPLGELDGPSARELIARLHAEGLEVEVCNTSSVSYTPVDRTNALAWLIEDDQESRRIVRDMMEAGVPVQDVMQ